MVLSNPISLGWDPLMEADKNALDETAEELRKRAGTEQDLEKFLELVSKLKSLIEAQRSKKKP
jgi:hypothetical protein